MYSPDSEEKLRFPSGSLVWLATFNSRRRLFFFKEKTTRELNVVPWVLRWVLIIFFELSRTTPGGGFSSLKKTPREQHLCSRWLFSLEFEFSWSWQRRKTSFSVWFLLFPPTKALYMFFCYYFIMKNNLNACIFSLVHGISTRTLSVVASQL